MSGARTILKARLDLYRNAALQPTPRYNENTPIGIHHKKKNKKNHTFKNNEKPVNIDRMHFKNRERKIFDNLGDYSRKKDCFWVRRMSFVCFDVSGLFISLIHI